MSILMSPSPTTRPHCGWRKPGCDPRHVDRIDTEARVAGVEIIARVNIVAIVARVATVERIGPSARVARGYGRGVVLPLWLDPPGPPAVWGLWPGPVL